VAKASPKTNTTVNPSEDELLAGGKGRPTPTRREREAANRRPLVGGSAEDRKAARARLNGEREKARVGMANGEERYLPAKDRGEQRRYIRDYIDARWGIGEAMMPVMLIVLLTAFVGAAAQSFSLLLIWAFVALFAIDCIVCWFLLRRRITAKWGEGSLQSRTFWYIVSRSFQMRFLRLPKPQVKRGQYPA
jgi:hypothetical protein